MGFKIWNQHKGRLIGSIIVMSLAIAVFSGMGATVDTLRHRFVAKLDYMYGGIHLSVYRSDYLYTNVGGENYTIPSHYIDDIRAVEGVERVIARKGKIMTTINANDFLDSDSNWVYEINMSNPDENYLGSGYMIDVIPSLGEPSELTFEDVLNVSGYTHPAIISSQISDLNGWNVNDEIIISCENYTKAYATPTELAMLGNGSISATELEGNIADDKSRWQVFQIVGIFVDGTETIESPVSDEFDSLRVISAKPNTVYVRKNASVDCVFNNNSGEYFFLVDINNNYQFGDIENALRSNPDNIPFAEFDLREHIQGFVEYSMALVTLFIMLLSVQGLLVSLFLIVSITHVNLIDNTKRIGLLASLGAKNRRLGEIVLPQLALIGGISVIIGVAIGYILPMNISLDETISSLARNKTFDTVVSTPIVYSPLTIILTLIVGILVPMLSGLIPLSKIRKWNIEELMHPEKMTMDMIVQKKIEKRFKKWNKKISREKRRKKIANTRMKLAESIMIRERKIWSRDRGKIFARNALLFIIAIVILSASSLFLLIDDMDELIPYLVENFCAIAIFVLISILLRKQFVKMYFFSKLRKTKKARSKYDKKIVRLTYGKKALKLINRNEKVFKIKKLILPIILIPIFAYLIHYFSLNLVPEGTFHTSESTYPYLGGVLIAAVFLIVCVCVVFKDVIAAFTAFISMGLKRWIGEFGNIIPKRVFNANKNRNRKNMTYFLIVVTSLVVTISSIYSSSLGREYDTNRTMMGGEIVVYEPMIHVDQIPSVLSSVSGIEAATLITFNSIDTWSFNDVEASQYLVNKFGSYGGKHDNITENLNVVIIDDVDVFLSVNKPSETFYEIVEPSNMNARQFMSTLKTDGTTVIQGSLAEDIGKGVGDHAILETFGMKGSLEITGIADFLPACPYMKFLDLLDISTTVSRTMMITRDTLYDLIEDYVGNIDVFIKNMSVDEFVQQHTNETIPTDYYGYTSSPIDTSVVLPLLNAIPEIDEMSTRFSTFAPYAPEVYTTYDPSRLLYENPNAIINESGNITLPSRFYAVDPIDEINITSDSETVIECFSWLNNNPLIGYDGVRRYNRTANEILYGLDNFYYYNDFNTRRSIQGNSTFCVTNKYVSMYEDVDNLTYVHENRVGDVLTVTFESNNETISQNFTIMGTIDNHFAFYYENGTERESYLLGTKSFNYNSRENIDNSTVIDLFDAAGNVIYTTIEELEYMEFLATKFPFGYATNELLNHIYIKIDDGANVNSVVNQINQSFISNSIYNLSIFPYKKTFHDKLTFMGSLSIHLADGANETEVLDDLRSWYVANNLTWRQSNVGAFSKYDSDIFYLSEAFEILNIMNYFTVTVSTIGMCITISIAIRKERRNIGFWKALGAKNKQIQRIIFVESFVANIAALLVGFVMGICLITLIMESISFGLIFPLRLVIPYGQIAILVGLNFVVGTLFSIGNSRYVMNLSIEENIQSF